MDRLVNDLLTLARLDEGVPMHQAPSSWWRWPPRPCAQPRPWGPSGRSFWAAEPVEVTGDKDCACAR